ncbi:transketolase [Ligilactobacillus sp. WILCCON 0076]|uniref:Transketolase n=1 Tax=Ligilactobacillus ubinensis TaxID=2876789 RepID=A0A9X2FJW3_9LACO|nr:transketolase [Ligilactobacillus ubinensis]MCP0887047.1 transketolase [Ligilactobacillus ubinensis]
MNTIELQKKALTIREAVWELIYSAKTGHTGSDFSCIDILTALYFDVLQQTPDTFGKPETDTYIQSKGHAVEALYETLALRGYFPKTDLNNFSGFKTHYIGHPTNDIHGIEMNTGSLGHGLGLGVGVALAAKMDKLTKKTFVLMGDGEQAEGSIWEAAMAAGNYHLDNLIGIIDHNKLQISGSTTSVMNSESLASKYTAFGWDVIEINGNDMTDLLDALHQDNLTSKPRLILANTIKGKGISFMENQANWHHKVPSESQYLEGLNELKAQKEALEND